MAQPVAAPASRQPVAVQPGFRGALQGIWSFTWKSRLTVRRLPALVITLGFLPSLTFFTIDAGGTKPYFHWLLDFYLLLILPLYCLAVCGAMIRDEVQADTLGFLLTRPLTRARLFLAKYLSHVAWLQIVVAAHGLLLLAAGYFREIDGIAGLTPLFLGTQALAVFAWGALSSLLGLINQRYMVLGLIYGFVVEMGIGRIPTNINTLSLTRHVKTLLGNSTVIHQLYEWPTKGTLFSILVMGVATVLFLGLGAALFTFKEYHHSEEMQK